MAEFSLLPHGSESILAFKIGAGRRPNLSQLHYRTTLVSQLRHFERTWFAWRWIASQEGKIYGYLLVRAGSQSLLRVAADLQQLLNNDLNLTPVTNPKELTFAHNPFATQSSVCEIRNMVNEVTLAAGEIVYNERLSTHVPQIGRANGAFTLDMLFNLLRTAAPAAVSLSFSAAVFLSEEVQEFRRLAESANTYTQFDWRGTRYTDAAAQYVAEVYYSYSTYVLQPIVGTLQVATPNPASAQKLAQDLVAHAFDSSVQQNGIRGGMEIVTPNDASQIQASQQTFRGVGLNQWLPPNAIPNQKLRRLPFLWQPAGIAAVVHALEVTQKPELKVKILFLAANPRETDALRLGEEARQIEERLRQAQLRDKFAFKQHHALRWSDLVQYLLDEQPDIVHFSGHGSSRGDLIFEDANGLPQLIPPTVLSRLFATLKDRVRYVIFNACWSKAQANALAQHIDYVVGMQSPVADGAAIGFAGGFYQGIGGKRTIRESFKLGCLELIQYGPEYDDVPMLLVRSGAALDHKYFQ